MLPGGHVGRVQVVAIARRGAPRARRARRRGGRPGSRSGAARRRSPTAARALKRPLWDVLDRLARVGAVSLRVEPPDTEAAALTERVASARRRSADPARARRAVPARAQAAPAVRGARSSSAAARWSGTSPASSVQRRACSGRWSSAGWCASRRAERLRDPFADFPAVPPPTESDRRPAGGALAAVAGAGPGRGRGAVRRHRQRQDAGVPRGGRRVLAAGRGAIVLVPEIGLTPQTVSRLRGAFGDQVAVLHSALSDGERADAWRLLRRGERRVAVGARSAIFAPVPRPRPDRARRGARGQLQERRDAALPRPRRGGRARPDRGRRPGARQRDAVARDDGAGRAPAPAAPAARARSARGRCRRSSWWTCASRPR